ncbi:DUF4649 family protein [Streptococcus thermophilus]|nr:DUF4649 family protein [Streptococcus thermophilus]
MIEISYLNAAKQECHISFEDYNEFVRAQQACWIAIPDSTPVTKVTINGHDIEYKGQFGDLYFQYYEVRLSSISVRKNEKKPEAIFWFFLL